MRVEKRKGDIEDESTLTSEAIAFIDKIAPHLRKKRVMEHIIDHIRRRFLVDGSIFFQEMSFSTDVWRHVVCSFLTVKDLVNLSMCCKYTLRSGLLANHHMLNNVHLNEPSQKWMNQTGVLLGGNFTINVENNITVMCASSEGKLVLGFRAGYCKLITSYDTYTHHSKFEVFSKSVPECICALPGDLMMVGDTLGEIRLWQLSSSPGKRTRCIRRLKAHSKSVLSLCFNTERNKMISTSRDSTIRVWRFSKNNVVKCIRTFHLPSASQATRSAFLTESLFVATVDHFATHKVQIWSLNSTGDEDLTSMNISETSSCVCALHDGSFAVGSGCEIAIWLKLNHPNSNEFPSFRKFRSLFTFGKVCDIKRLPTPDDRIVSVDDNFVLQIWDLRSQVSFNKCDKRIILDRGRYFSQRMMNLVDIVNSPSYGLMLVAASCEGDTIRFVGGDKLPKKLESVNTFYGEKSSDDTSDESFVAVVDDTYWW